MFSTPALRRVSGMRLVAVALMLSVVAGACATSLEINVTASNSAGTDRPGSHIDGSPDSPRAEASAEPASTPPPAVVEQPTSTQQQEPPPELSYDDAIDTYFADVERFWTDVAPAELGLVFEPVQERVPYDPEGGTIPACDGEVGPRELYAGNAFYCEPDDYIAWDDEQLFPDLYRVYGDFTVGLVIAHEYGHAVQARAAFDGPTIVLELQADCLAGAWARSVSDGNGVGIPFERADLDNAIGGFLTFADPLGTLAADPGAHGTAFDRLNAFAEGFERGVAVCSGYIQSPPQTASLLIDLFDTNEGNLPLDALLPLLAEDLGIFLAATGEMLTGVAFDAPSQLVEFGGSLGAPPPCGDVGIDAEVLDGSAYLCEADNTVYADRAALDDMFFDVGDFAPSYAVAHSFAVGVAAKLVSDPTAAVLAADCLVGVWARDVFDEASERPDEPTHVLILSAGDLDEGIVGLLLAPPTGPSLAELAPITTFDRVASFGAGFFRGTDDCGFG